VIVGFVIVGDTRTTTTEQKKKKITENVCLSECNIIVFFRSFCSRKINIDCESALLYDFHIAESHRKGNFQRKLEFFKKKRKAVKVS